LKEIRLDKQSQHLLIQAIILFGIHLIASSSLTELSHEAGNHSTHYRPIIFHS
jgi:hypothetical protein